MNCCDDISAVVGDSDGSGFPTGGCDLEALLERVGRYGTDRPASRLKGRNLAQPDRNRGLQGLRIGKPWRQASVLVALRQWSLRIKLPSRTDRRFESGRLRGG